jgi:hypothetical protein
VTSQLDRIEEKLDALMNLLTTGELPAVTEVFNANGDAWVDPGPAPKQRQKRVTEVDTIFRLKMESEFNDVRKEEVNHQIDLAMAHKASTKYHDKQTYVRNWLKKAVAYQAAHATPVSRGQDAYDRDFERRKAEDN